MVVKVMRDSGIKTWMSFEVEGKEAERVCGRGPQSSQDQGNVRIFIAKWNTHQL